MEITDLGSRGFASCCYLVTQNCDAVLIDCSAPVSTVKAALQAKGCDLHAILCTHGHFDHILTADAMREAFGVPLYIHEADAEMLPDGHKNAYSTFFGGPFSQSPPERVFIHGDLLTFGSLSLQAMHTPGHSRGSSVFLSDETLFSGDTLFAGGYGRTDLYGGDAAALRRSLQGLSALDSSLTVYPGHGESTTLKHALNILF